MAVHTFDGLEPQGHWEQVCALANDLLTELRLSEWDVTVRPQTPARDGGDGQRLDGAGWTYEADLGAKQFTVAVPPGCRDADDGEPEDVATYIVLDLLYDKVYPDGGDRADE
jgi:hypothetical protein